MQRACHSARSAGDAKNIVMRNNLFRRNALKRVMLWVPDNWWNVLEVFVLLRKHT